MPTRASCVPGSNGSPPATAASTSSTRARARGSGSGCGCAARGASRRCAAPTARDAEAALARALAIAEAQPAVPDAAPLAPEPPARGEWSSRLRARPVRGAARGEAGRARWRPTPGCAPSRASTLTRARFSAFQTDKVFASTEGALCEQRVIECGGGIAAVAVDGGESQIRSYPASHGGHVAQAGYEHFLGLELPGHAPRVAAEAVALLSAPACPPGRTTLILGGRAARAPGARVGRPRGGARPGARPRGLVRRHRASCRPTASARSGSAPST